MHGYGYEDEKRGNYERCEYGKTHEFESVDCVDCVDCVDDDDCDVDFEDGCDHGVDVEEDVGEEEDWNEG